jgi:hypothetical protein
MASLIYVQIIKWHLTTAKGGNIVVFARSRPARLALAGLR